MSRRATVQECDQAITELLPDLPRPEQKELACLVTGVVLKETCVLSKAAAAVPGDGCEASKMRRAQRLVATERLDVPRAASATGAGSAALPGPSAPAGGRHHHGATPSRQGTATLMLAVA